MLPPGDLLDEMFDPSDPAFRTAMLRLLSASMVECAAMLLRGDSKPLVARPQNAIVALLAVGMLLRDPDRAEATYSTLAQAKSVLMKQGMSDDCPPDKTANLAADLVEYGAPVRKPTREA